MVMDTQKVYPNPYGPPFEMWSAVSREQVVADMEEAVGRGENPCFWRDVLNSIDRFGMKAFRAIGSRGDEDEYKWYVVGTELVDPVGRQKAS